MTVQTAPLVLEEIPLFASLSLRQRSLIRERSRIIEVKKGEVIYEEGETPSNFYCVLMGRVVVYAKNAHGSTTVLEYLHRGKYFGIISLLTGEPHSVTAKAINDTLLLVIAKDEFDALLQKIPALAIDVSRMLSRRLKDKDLHPKIIFESTIVSVYSSYSRSGKSLYALNLALSLRQETYKSVLVLDICTEEDDHALPERCGISTACPSLDIGSPISNAAEAIAGSLTKTRYGIELLCLTYKSQEATSIKRMVEVLSALVNDFHFIILDLPAAMDQFVFEILNQSDVIHLLTSSEQTNLKRTRHLISRLSSSFHFPDTKVKVIINEYKLAKHSYAQQLTLLGRDVFATLPKVEFTSGARLILDRPDTEYAKTVRRISRQLGDCLVGLALGVGAGYGLCHIGVLKVIEEEKIPIDVIAGSSMGAFVASLWATGMTSTQILELVSEFKEPKHIFGIIDLTLPFLGLIKGHKLYKFLKRHLGNKTFYDARLPLKIIASDIRKKEYRVLEKGSLVDAIMASCSMPGVFRPFHFKEEMLIDGGLVSPLPTEPLFSMGVRKIIAVNVTPSRDDILAQFERMKHASPEAVPAGMRKVPFMLKRYLRERFKTNILDIIFSSIELMQSELAQRESVLADVVLHPDVSGMHWLELHRARDFARRGEEETRRHIDAIWKVIRE